MYAHQADALGNLPPRRGDRRALPHDCTVANGAGLFFSGPATYLRGHGSRRFLFMFDFDAIGQAIPNAFGAVGDPTRPVVLLEGDASALMSVTSSTRRLATIRGCSS